MQLELGQIGQQIELLEGMVRARPVEATLRLELGNLYLWVGKHAAASEQYRQLKASNPTLASAPKKLMARHRSSKRGRG